MQYTCMSLYLIFVTQVMQCTLSLLLILEESTHHGVTSLLLPREPRTVSRQDM